MIRRALPEAISLAPWLALLLAACGPSLGGGGGRPGEQPTVDGGATVDGGHRTGPMPFADAGSGAPTDDCTELSGCYTVYAHGDHVLYHLDLKQHMLVEVGPFKAPVVGGYEDTMTDLAVAPDDTIYVVSHTTLYTASPTDGHVTVVGSLKSCGSAIVALTFTPDTKLYTADYKGAFCRIDLAAGQAPNVVPIATLARGLAVAGDLVAVGDGTMYATVYDLNDSTTTTDNILVQIDPATGTLTKMGATGFPKLFGVAFDRGQVFGFTHDGSGDVVTIDPKTGLGTPYGSFTDPSTGKGIAFAGAGVNSKVAPPIQ